jgi:hypothetical protein
MRSRCCATFTVGLGPDADSWQCPLEGPLRLQCSVGQADLAVGGDVRRPSACDFCSREDGYPRAESPGFSRSANGATDLDPNDSFSRYSVQRASPSGCRADSSDLVARAQRPPAKGRAPDADDGNGFDLQRTQLSAKALNDNLLNRAHSGNSEMSCQAASIWAAVCRKEFPGGARSPHADAAIGGESDVVALPVELVHRAVRFVHRVGHGSVLDIQEAQCPR